MGQIKEIGGIRSALVQSGIRPEPKMAGLGAYHTTDMGNSRRLVDLHGHDLKFISQAGWYHWTGKRWEKDETGEVIRRMKNTVRSIYTEAANTSSDDFRKKLSKHATSSESDHKIRAAISLAQSELEVVATFNQFDANPFLLNVNNGTLDLTNGELQEHSREDLISRISPVDYEGDVAAPIFARFLHRIMDGNTDLMGFIQRACGYVCSGDTREQCLFILHGLGANGKTTLIQVISAALGDYAIQTPSDTLLIRRNEGIPNDIARLKGARLVTASEAEEGKRLAESLVKQMTGGDKVTARFLHREFFEFEPTFKVFLATNHKPIIWGTDTAIWRRIRLVPFDVTIAPKEQDKELLKKLLDELPGILHWAVSGCLEWQQAGLRPPKEVRRATGAYMQEMDVLGTFVSECCSTGSALHESASNLYEAYKEWAEENGEYTFSQKRLGKYLSEKGFESTRITSGPDRGKKEWLGIEVKE
ncbi:phage/plasmid primase, P4 family [Acidobacteria bacterium AH-259-D05]|nr:phage/plasmid primase, P4 family [Acidobacteria bacterium AH-259-D05]